jgi:hypothetical protein
MKKTIYGISVIFLLFGIVYYFYQYGTAKTQGTEQDSQVISEPEDDFDIASPDSLDTTINEEDYVDGMLRSCSNAVECIRLRNGVITIDRERFERYFGDRKDARKITKVVIEKNVRYIDNGDMAFERCYNLRSIEVSPDNAFYSSEDGVLFNKDKTKLIRYPEGKRGASYTVPSSVTSISINAFVGCIYLKSIKNCASYIDGVCFWDDGRELIRYLAGKRGAYTIPDNVRFIHYEAFRRSAGLTAVVIPDAVSNIRSKTFSECTALTSVKIGDGMYYIADDAFANCPALTSIEVDEDNRTYRSIDGVLFKKDKSVLILYPQGKQGPYTIPGSVTKIEPKAFSGCIGLTSLTIGKKVDDVLWYKFLSDCVNLTSIHVDDGNSRFCSIDGVLFNKAMQDLLLYPRNRHGVYKIPKGIKSLSKYAFQNCAGLTAVTIPSSTILLYDYSFSGCTGLEYVISLNPVPPKVSFTNYYRGGGSNRPYIFEKVTTTLYVPANSIAAYRKAKGWSYIKNIKPLASAPKI